MKIYFAIDVGGTTIKYGIFDEKKNLIDKFFKKTIYYNKNAERQTLNDILSGIEEWCSEKKISLKDIVGIGIAVPGPVADNEVKTLVNINWKHKYDVVSNIKNRFGSKVKVIIANDANAALYGEYIKTLKGKYKNVCFITLGTGIGGGILLNGKLLEGKTGVCGELGHIIVDKSENAMECNCGNKGCLETIASGVGIVNVYKNLYLSDKSNDDEIGICGRKVKVNELNAKLIIDAAKENDEKAFKVLDIAFEYLANLMVDLVYVIEPDVFLIGGGISNGGNIILDIIKKHFVGKNKLTKKQPKIMLAKLKNDAGIYGAFALVANS